MTYKPKCETCEWWELLDMGVGECHRRCPTYVPEPEGGDSANAFPITSQYAWCGEHSELGGGNDDTP